MTMSTTDAERETRQSTHVGTEVGDGVYRFGSDGVNWYLVDDDGDLTLVDAGLPNHWQLLHDGLDSLGFSLADIEALILTHTDPDHIGFAERLRSQGVPVWVHGDEYDDALAGGRDLDPRVLLRLWHPATVRFMLALRRAGMFSVQGITEAKTFEDGQELDVPGSPTAIHVLGHTVGQTAFWVADRRVLFSGDSLLTIDLKTWKRCDPKVTELFDADVDQARRSTQRLAAYDDVILLPGHGPPWTGNLRDTLATKPSKRAALTSSHG